MSTEPAITSTGRIDFTLMYVTHDAFRRDLSRLRRAAADGRTDSVGVQAGWANFKRQLHVHHTAEDEALWPRVEAASAGRADAAEILAAMEAEHARLDPLLEAVDAAMDAAADAAMDQRAADLAELTEVAADLETALNAHMKHEEVAALPLIQEVLTPEDWTAFARVIARKQKLSGAAAYVPWVIDGAAEDQRAAFFTAMPAPVKVLNRLFWSSRYHKRHPWA